MFQSIVPWLASVIAATISSGGYLGIIALMAIESACIPLPSEIIMPFSGYLASIGRFELIAVATAGAIGCNLGSTVAYAAGRLGGRPLAERWGRYVLMSRHDFELTDRFFARYGGITVFVTRLLPLIRTFIALPAGIARMPQGRFQVYTFVGSWLWCYGLAYIGFALGEKWNKDPRLAQVLHRFDALVLGVLVLGLGWYLWRHLRSGHR